MRCYCPECQWKFVTDAPAQFTCPQCRHTFHCDPSGDAQAPVEHEPIEAGDWPRWAKACRWLRDPTDTGVGDTVQRIAAKVGGEQFKQIAERLNIPCGCSGRQDEWNRLYPYD